jgi:hypothetical protein
MGPAAAVAATAKGSGKRQAHGSASGSACCYCCDSHVPSQPEGKFKVQTLPFFFFSLCTGLLDLNGSE